MGELRGFQYVFYQGQVVYNITLGGSVCFCCVFSMCVCVYIVVFGVVLLCWSVVLGVSFRGVCFVALVGGFVCGCSAYMFLGCLGELS